MLEDRGWIVRSHSVELNMSRTLGMQLYGISNITRHVTSWFHVCWHTHTHTHARARAHTHMEHSMTFHWNNCSGSIPKVMCFCSGFWWVMRRSVTMLNPQEKQQAFDRHTLLDANWRNSNYRHLFDCVLWHPQMPASGLQIIWQYSHCKLFMQIIQYVHTKMKNRQPGKLTDGIIILHDSVHSRVAHRVKEQLIVIQWEVLRHPAYSMDYHLQFSHPVVIKESNQFVIHVFWIMMCARLLYSGLGSSRISLQVGYNDLCASVGWCKMCLFSLLLAIALLLSILEWVWVVHASYNI
jgi:hypothetical protein